MKKKPKQLPLQTFKKARLVLFILVFGILGTVFLRLSLAAETDTPVGYADYCQLESGKTVIYGWAHDQNTPAGALPNVTVRAGSSSLTVPTNRYYRETQINSYLTTYTGQSTSAMYGFRAEFSGLYKDVSYIISGTIHNVGAGSNAPLAINNSTGVDGGGQPYFASNAIPSVCLATRPAAPPPTPPPPPAPSPTPTPTPTPTPASPSAPRPSASPQTPVVTAQPDAEKPSSPSNLQASFEESSVALFWNAATDNVAVQSYTVERSLDKTTWLLLTDTDGTSQESFNDSTIVFNSTYHYRVQAKDQSGNLSGYAEVSIQTGSFEPNAFADKELVLTSDDQILELTIPSGAVAAEAVCALRASQYLSPGAEDHATISGPYELLCKQANGTPVTEFSKPIRVVIQLNPDDKKRFTQIKAYTYEDDWQTVDVDSSNSFVLGASSHFAVLGQLKKSPLWQKVVIVVVILAAILVSGLLLMNRLYRRKLTRTIAKKQKDYYNKERGF